MAIKQSVYIFSHTHAHFLVFRSQPRLHTITLDYIQVESFFLWVRSFGSFCKSSFTYVLQRISLSGVSSQLPFHTCSTKQQSPCIRSVFNQVEETLDGFNTLIPCRCSHTAGCLIVSLDLLGYFSISTVPEALWAFQLEMIFMTSSCKYCSSSLLGICGFLFSFSFMHQSSLCLLPPQNLVMRLRWGSAGLYLDHTNADIVVPTYGAREKHTNFIIS